MQAPDPISSQSARGAARDAGDDPWARAWEELSRLGREARTIARLRWERARLFVKERAHDAALLVLLAVALAAAVVVACTLLLLGIAGALGALFGGAVWAGQLVVGLAVLAGCGALLAAARARMRGSVLADVRRRYARSDVEARDDA